MPLLRFPLLALWHAPYLDLPHIATMGRDEILQQTRFKTLKCKPPLKNASLVLK
ncbi:hypothetical protein ACQJ87_03900 [Helicobacter pylori]